MYTQDLEILNPELQTKQMSEKYQLMDTRQLVTELLALGGGDIFELHPTKGIFCPIKRKTQTPYAQHHVRVRIKQPVVAGGDVLHYELRIKNSYDGSCQFEVNLGIFRLVCSNGLVVKLEGFGDTKIRHIGTPAEEAMNIARQLGEQLPEIRKVRELFVERQLTDAEKIEFAMKAAKIRWEGKFTEADATKLLESTRPEDDGNSLWVVYNRVQEKMLNSGFKTEGMKKSSKEIRNAHRELELNQTLFELANSFIEVPEVQADLENYAKVNEDSFEAPVEEVADLEMVEIPEAPNKFVYEGPSRKRVKNPAYEQWVELYGDLV